MNAAQTADHTGTLTVATRTVSFQTRGDADTVNVTARIAQLLTETGLDAGTVTVFAPGATGAVTTLEYEPGVVQDFQRLFDEVASPDRALRPQRQPGRRQRPLPRPGGPVGPLADGALRGRPHDPGYLAGDLLRLLRQPATRPPPGGPVHGGMT